MSAFTAEGNASAVAALAEAKAFAGSQNSTKINLWHRSEPPAAYTAQLYAVFPPDALSIGGDNVQRGRYAELGMLHIYIPIQAGFAVMTDNKRPITPSDVIEWPISSGRYFTVHDGSDIKQLANGYVYDVTAIERKTLTAGTNP